MYAYQREGVRLNEHSWLRYTGKNCSGGNQNIWATHREGIRLTERALNAYRCTGKPRPSSGDFLKWGYQSSISIGFPITRHLAIGCYWGNPICGNPHLAGMTRFLWGPLWILLGFCSDRNRGECCSDCESGLRIVRCALTNKLSGSQSMYLRCTF